MTLLLALLHSAQAYEPVGIGLHAGANQVTNDPFLARRGLHLGLEYAPRPMVSFGVLLAGYPDLGRADWSPLTVQLVEENHVSPDLSRIMGRADAVMRIVPLRREGERMATSVGFHTGIGLVRTKDDLEALQAVGDPIAESSQLQLHPTTIYGLTAELRTAYVVGFRLRYEFVHYIETVNATTLETKLNAMAGAEVMAWF